MTATDASSGFSIQRDGASAEYFDAAAEGSLLIRRCPVCGDLYPPEQRRCRDSDALESVPAAGTGKLVTWAADPLVVAPELTAPDGQRSVFGIVELDEGPWLQAPILGCSPDDLAADARMTVCFVRPGGGEAIAAFTLA
ncbi:MAG: OB-fold domain-containing protein [Acidimicrobiia bacterium]